MSFKKQYRDLEMMVLSTIRDMITNSKRLCTQSYADVPCIDIDANGFKYLAVVNDRVVIIHDGYHYNVPNKELNLEDLIDIIEAHKE